MIDLKFIRQNHQLIREAINLKNLQVDLDNLLELDATVLALKQQVQQLEEQKNQLAQKIAKSTLESRGALLEAGKAVSVELALVKPKLRDLEEELTKLLWLIPNIPAADVPVGKDESDNIEIKKVGEIPTFSFKILDHVAILEQHSWADLARISKIAGSRSYALTNDMVLLEIALLRFVLEKMKNKGFTLISVPALARDFAFIGTGHFPTAKDQAYFIPEDDLYLTGTAEVILNALHSEENLTAANLPILYAGFSPCFRREAGSAGKDTRGLIRVHQFYKVEQFIICKNSIEESEYWHQQLLHTAEEIMQDLELPYRIVQICTGDLGAGKYKQHDLEAWVPSENKYRETHSCSSLLDWQARRINLRYRDNTKLRYCFTLNNTAIATPRILVPFLENHQQRDGSIKIPSKLKPYISVLG